MSPGIDSGAVGRIRPSDYPHPQQVPRLTKAVFERGDAFDFPHKQLPWAVDLFPKEKTP